MGMPGQRFHLRNRPVNEKENFQMIYYSGFVQFYGRQSSRQKMTNTIELNLLK